MNRIFRSAAAALVLTALPFAASAQHIIKIAAKQEITHEKLWLMKRVGAPVPSPDGNWIVFSVTEPAYDEKDQVADLWIVPADSSTAPRRLTSRKASESGVTWSPDSHRIAFSSKREKDEQSQIYVLDVTQGGEAQRVTNVSTGAQSPQFSPDGNALLFSSVVYPAAADDDANKAVAKERKDRKANVRVYDSFPVRAWDRWLDDMQTHLLVQPLDDSGTKAKDVLAGTALVKSAGFAGRGGEGSRDDLDPQWAPDGSIVFVATTARNTAAFAEVPTDLYRIGSEGGEPQLLTKSDGNFSRVRFSADGKYLFALYSPNNKLPFNGERIVRYDWPSMANRIVITPRFDRSVGTYVVSADNRNIYLTAEDAGLEKFYVVPATGGDVKQDIEQDSGVYTGLALASKAPNALPVALWGSSINPAEVVQIDAGKHLRRSLTTFNSSQAERLDWLGPRHFWFTNSAGMKIHSMLIVPERFDESKKYPLFVLIHGGAANMWRDQITLRWNYHLLAKPGYVVLLTDYRGSTGYGDKFAQAIQGDPLKGPGDDINAAADEAIKQFPFIDGTRQFAGGASYGGHLANWLEATTTRYKCLISHAGLVNLESQWGTSDGIYHRELMAGGPVWEQNAVWKTQNPIRYAASFKTPMLLSVGEHDYRVPMNETLENWAALQRMKVPSRLLVFPDENHWIQNGENSKVFYREVADWIARWVPANPPS